MKNFNNFNILCSILIIFLLLIITACDSIINTDAADPAAISLSLIREDLSHGNEVSFRDIPGITEEEIRAIEDLQRSGRTFVYGMNPSTEAFVEFGEVRGFASLVAGWLTDIFRISFIPAIYEWGDLISGLESGEIDFTGELTATPERQQIYHMTDTIAMRSIKYIRMEGSLPLQSIITTRTPRYAFLENSLSMDFVDRFTQYYFESYFVSSYEEAHNLLITNQIDAFFADNSMESVFDNYSDITISDFIPVIGMPVSLSTQNRDLWPIISVVQKALENGADEYLKELYKLGNQEHRRHRLNIKLNEEELAFLQSNPVIPFAAEYFNYPVSFFNRHDRQWQGIYFDILDELRELTGLQFVLVNDETDDFPVLLAMLERGEAYLISELLQSEARMGRFRWLSTPSITNNYALISKTDTPNVSINEVLNMRVGIQASTAYADMFHSWFPLHTNTIEYEGSRDAMEALGEDKVDLVMSSQIHLLALTNYYELSGYKANLIFVHAAESYIGFNLDQAILCSIIDKAFDLIDVNGIASRWASITFDYQARLLESQRPWLIGAIILSATIISLLIVLYIISHNSRRRLGVLVKERTRELEIATEAANTANRSKSTFLANMSHEIRTPMNTILGVTEIMIQDESITDDIEEKLNKIYSSSDLLMGIINDILDFSKIEAGKLDIISAKYFIASLVNDSIQLNMMRIGDKPIQFEINIDENIPANLLGDELRIKQVLNNLLSNAFKYTEAGMVTLSVFCEPSENGNEDEINLGFSVRDTGRGMSKEQIEKMFDEYSRFDEESSPNIEGTGLGLSITQKLISLMNGKIQVESVPKAGSLFTVRLPQGKPDSELIGKELAESLQQFRNIGTMNKKRGQIAKDPMPYGKVLVVDDVETNLYVAEGLMKPYMLHIETVGSGKSAINRIKEGRSYDIIFMDHMMPVMDGLEATKLIRELGYKEPIVALTANAVAGQADMFLQSGFDDFISKPIDLRQLNSILNRLIRDKQDPEIVEEARMQAQKLQEEIEERALQERNNAVQDRDFSVLSHKNADGKPAGLEQLVGNVAGLLLNGDYENAEEVIAKFADLNNSFNNNSSVSMDFSNINIKGLEFNKGLERFENDEELYIKVLRSYSASIYPLLEILDNVNEEFILDYQRAAHSIKGTSLDIAAFDIGNKARELEEAAKQKDMDFIGRENPAFIDNVSSLVKSIDSMLSDFDSVNVKSQKDKIDRDLLLKLFNFCKEYDMDGVDEVIAEIEKYQYGSEEELSLWLRKNIDVVDFEGIAERLSGII